jgi:4-amino-4-deoxychorismate lyase
MMRVDGEPRSELSALDRGLAYGDGVFETLAVVDGGPRDLERHLRRLRDGLQRLGIGGLDDATLAAETRDMCLGVARGVLKLIVTRGVGGRGYRPPEAARPTRIVSLHPWPDYPASYAETGVEVRVCRTRLGLNPGLAGIKHLNRLEQVLARAEWDDECQEGLMLDLDGRVIEGTMSNVFVIRDDALLTPAVDRAGIAGIIRERVIEHAGRLGIPCRIEAVSLDQVYTGQGLFLCNSIIGIWPVRRLEGKDFTLPTMTRELIQGLGLGEPA